MWRILIPLPPAYLALVIDENANPDLYRMRLDGSDMLRLTDHPAIDHMPAWSPDGKQVVFVSTRDGNEELYSISANGDHLQRLTDNLGADTEPVWSPNGKWIAFKSVRNGQNDIYRLNPDGTNLVRLTNTPLAKYHLKWSPDSQFVLYTANITGFWEFYLASVEGGQIPRTLISNGFDNLWLNALPQGRGFSYVVRQETPQIYWYDWRQKTSHHLQSVAPHNMYEAALRNQAIWVRGSPKELWWQQFQQETRLHDTLLNSLDQVMWSSDYRAILFSAVNEQGNFQIYHFELATQHKTLLSKPELNTTQVALPLLNPKSWQPWGIMFLIILGLVRPILANIRT